MVRTPQQRFAAVLDLYEFAKQQMRSNLRRRYPSATEEALDERMREWALRRPGAPYGDAVGRVTRLKQ